MAKASEPGWQVHRHGGGRKLGWRRAFTGNERPAWNQVNLIRFDMRQGGVRLVDPKGVIVESWWRRHAPDAEAERVEKDIGRRARLG